MSALLDALEIGNGLRVLMQRDSSYYSGKGIDDYPAISPMLALRKSTKSVLETVALEGDFIDDGQQLVAYSRSEKQK